MKCASANSTRRQLQQQRKRDQLQRRRVNKKKPFLSSSSLMGMKMMLIIILLFLTLLVEQDNHRGIGVLFVSGAAFVYTNNNGSNNNHNKNHRLLLQERASSFFSSSSSANRRIQYPQSIRNKRHHYLGFGMNRRRTAPSVVLHAAASSREPDFNSNDPFVVLGLTPSPTLDKKEIKRAYRRLALKYHPDVVVNNGAANGANGANGEDKKRASDHFAKINWAYRVLSGKEQQTTTKTTSTTGASSKSSGGGWTPPHRRQYAGSASSSSYSSSTSGTGNKSTDWRDYMPYSDDEDYDTDGDSFGAIFRDLFVGAASGGRTIFTDFVEFLEDNADGYGIGSGDADVELRTLLQTGSVEDIGEEMDDTELIVQQLTSKLSSLNDELLDINAELSQATRYSQKIQWQEKLEEVKARQNVVEGYLNKSRKRLLKLQTRYKELIVDGNNDPVAGGRSRSAGSSSRTWSRNTTPSSGSTTSGSSRSSYSSSSTTTGQSSRRRHENPDEAWKDDSFGSFGRGRGSSSGRRRSTRRRQAAASTSTSESASARRQQSYNAGEAKRAPSSSSSSTPYTASRSSATGSSPSSSSSGQRRTTDVPPHRRPRAQPEKDDQSRLRELKVDEEFDKLKKDLGLL